MYLVFYVGFICKGCVREKVCEDSRQLKTKGVFAGSSRLKVSCKVKHVPCIWQECEELGQDGDSWFSRVSRG